MRWFRLLVVIGLVVGMVPGAALPASAAARRTQVAEAVDQATVHVGSLLMVSGKATPVRAGAVVTLQSFDGHAWKVVAHQKSSAAGTFAFVVKAPRVPGTWLLRVSRAAGGGSKAGVGATLHVRVVRKAFAVTAKATLTRAYGRVAVSGRIAPSAAGTVRIQRLVGKAWVTMASPRLTKAATYSATVTLASGGSYFLRVLKPFSTTTAQGASKPQRVTIPVADPKVATTTLPKAVVGRPFAATFAVSSGVGPYTWSVAGLPAGLTASRIGAITGITSLPGVFAIAAAVTDSRGRTGVATLSLTVQQTHVMSWGYNASGQLGNGTLTDTTSAVTETGIDGVTAVAATPSLVLLLRDDGTVWCQGYTGDGACGVGPLTSATTPQHVPGLTSVVAVAAGGGTGYALTADGTVWASGYNANGELGNGTTTRSRVFQPVLGLGRAVAIAAGRNTGYALLADGTVWAWGYDADGELGQDAIVPTSTTPVQVHGLANVKAISAIYYDASALMADGTVRTWGRGVEGELGNGGTTGSATPVAVSGLSGVRALASNVTVLANYAIRSDGTLWAWGGNMRGEIGDGTTTNRPVPVQVPGLTNVVAVSAGSTQAYAVLADGTLEAWGEGSSGGLGDGDSSDHFRTSPAPVPGVAGAVAAAGGEAFGVAVIAS